MKSNNTYGNISHISSVLAHKVFEQTICLQILHSIFLRSYSFPFLLFPLPSFRRVFLPTQTSFTLSSLFHSAIFHSIPFQSPFTHPLSTVNTFHTTTPTQCMTPTPSIPRQKKHAYVNISSYLTHGAQKSRRLLA